MNRGFYREFEERHYAPRSAIKELRKQYLPFLEDLAKNHKHSLSFDIGCGRGEWLELMNEVGFSASGIDLDQSMLQDCHDRNLDVILGDGVAHLASLPDNSYALITAFHVVEHIDFSQLTALVRDAKRVLIPGGMLILETPNPENLVVGTSNFYLDPTHQRPIPLQLLSFLVEHEGFARVETVRMQENKALKEACAPTLYEVLSGVSPDYSVIAVKAGPGIEPKIIDCLSDERGLSLRSIAGQFDQHLKLRWEEVEAHYSSLQHQLQYLKNQIARLPEENNKDKDKSDLLHEVFSTKSRLEYVENQNGLTFSHMNHEIDANRQEIVSLRTSIQLLTGQLDNAEREIRAMNLSPFWIVRTTIRWLKLHIKNFRA